MKYENKEVISYDSTYSFMQEAQEGAKVHIRPEVGQDPAVYRFLRDAGAVTRMPEYAGEFKTGQRPGDVSNAYSPNQDHYACEVNNTT